jgi:uncharacterized protein YwgA
MTERASEWDQYAVIAYLADKLGGTRRLGKKAMQKYVHLIQDLARVPVGYRFSFYTYGPYSSDLAGDLDILNSMNGIAIVFDDEDNAYRISSAENAAFFIDKGMRFLEHNKEKIDWIVDQFRGRFAKDLELTSTIVFLCENAFEDEKRDKKGVMEMVRQLKPKYSAEQISRAVKELESLDYSAISSH